MRPTTLFALPLASAVVAVTLAGCFLADPAPSQLNVRNDTGATFWLDQDPTTDQDPLFKARPDGFSSVSTEECVTRPVEAQRKGGDVIATLDREWCPGQRWVVRGQDDWSLEDTP